LFRVQQAKTPADVLVVYEAFKSITHGRLQLTFNTTTRKWCLSSQTCTMPLFCDCDLEGNLMTLKLKGDQDILKMCIHNENEVASLKHSKLKKQVLKI